MFVQPIDPSLSSMFTLSLHDSLITGLLQERATGFPEIDPDRLDEWADTCENPSGQRAALARALAHLGRVTPIRFVATSTERTFWDAVANP